MVSILGGTMPTHCFSRNSCVCLCGSPSMIHVARTSGGVLGGGGSTRPMTLGVAWRFACGGWRRGAGRLGWAGARAGVRVWQRARGVWAFNKHGDN
jgi:hypothetical protein